MIIVQLDLTPYYNTFNSTFYKKKALFFHLLNFLQNPSSLHFLFREIKQVKTPALSGGFKSYFFLF